MKNILWLAVLFSFIAGESFAQTLANSQELGVLNFNQYYNGANVVARTTGYSGMIYTDLTSGNFVLETGGTNTAGATVTRSPLVTVTAVGALGIGTSTPRVSVDLGYKTDALILQSGTTGQRPTAVEGMIRYNSTTSKVEAYQGGSWTLFGGTTTAGSTMYLGADATHTSPSRSGDVTTGLFSDTATSVSVSIAGTERFKVNSSGVDVPDIANAYYLAGEKILSFPGSSSESLAVGSGALMMQTGTYSRNTAIGYEAMAINTGSGEEAATDNTAVGLGALGSNVGNGDWAAGFNTAVGRLALNDNDGSGEFAAADNVAVGADSLRNNSGLGVNAASLNTAIGPSALDNNYGAGYSSGSMNVAIGWMSLSGNSGSGGDGFAAQGNVAIGNSALFLNTGSGSGAARNNVAIGQSALWGNSGIGEEAGSYNVAIGIAALYGNSGRSNTALGSWALSNDEKDPLTGSYNLALGYGVGSEVLVSGSHNILIGTTDDVDTPAADTSNWLNIGNTIYGDMAAGGDCPYFGLCALHLQKRIGLGKCV